MSAMSIVSKLRSMGIAVNAKDELIELRPASKIDEQLRLEIVTNKTEILRLLAAEAGQGWGVVPPDNLALTPEMPRPTPQVRDRMINYLIRQGCDRPSPLVKWLAQRENRYYETLGREWDCSLFAYAASRDAAMWQLSRSETEVLELLRSLESVPKDIKRVEQ